MPTVKLRRTLKVDLTDVEFDDLEGNIRFQMYSDDQSLWSAMKQNMVERFVQNYLKTNQANLINATYIFRFYEWHGIPAMQTVSIKK